MAWRSKTASPHPGKIPWISGKRSGGIDIFTDVERRWVCQLYVHNLMWC